MKWLIEHINDYVIAPLVPAVLIICGFYITARLRFLYVTKFKVIMKAMLRKNRGDGVSPFRALTAALAGTLGVGNILGVASAVCAGGAGSVFWMWIGALLSMMIKYCEVVLAVNHRQKGINGFFGGAMYYIKNKGWAEAFAILCVLASFLIGNFIQMQAISETMKATFGLPPIVCGVFIALLVYLTICKGFKRLSTVTVILIPFACAAFLLLSLYVIIDNLCYVPSALLRIVKEAFSAKAAAGGAIGVSVMQAVRYGISRGLISNESGCGTAPMAHAEADTDCPVEQGFWGIFEVFADTIILCTASALVILISFDKFSYLSGMELVIACFSVSVGRAAGYIVSALILIFAFATVVGWSHYGQISLSYVTDSKKIQKLYVLMYSFCCIPAVYFSSSIVWSVTDIILGVMTFINMFWIMKRLGEVRRLTDEYLISS